MPKINITETDNTVANLSGTNSNNIVYIPGTAITGPYDAPKLVTSLAEFKSIFGATGCANSPTWYYVAGLLTNGLPVLFRRVAGKNMDTDMPEILIKSASATMVNSIAGDPITVTKQAVGGTQSADVKAILEGYETVHVTLLEGSEFTGPDTKYIVFIDNSGYLVGQESIELTMSGDNLDTEIAIPQGATSAYIFDSEDNIELSDVQIEVPGEATKYEFLRVTDIYGGTYGNNLFATIEVLKSAVYFKVFYGANLIENVRLCVRLEHEGEESPELIARVAEAIEVAKFETVEVEVIDKEHFSLNSKFVTRVQLENGADMDEKDVEAEMPNMFEFVKDKYIYDFKFISAGGYTDKDSSNLAISNAMIDLAETRQDAVAILDVPEGLDKNDVTDFFSMVDTSYAAAFAPWCYMKLFDNTYDWMPPSYVFFRVLGKSVKDGNSIWEVPAGVIRATIKECIKPQYEIGGDTLQDWQESNPQCVNPIMKIRSYGYVIYGNRTLFNMEDTANVRRSALQELGVRIVTNDIKRAIFDSSLYLTFCNNNLHTWNEFKAKLEPTLKEMQSVRAITDYQVIMDETTVTDEYISANKIYGIVRVAVARGVEDFDIAFELESANVTFADEESEIDV